MPAQVFAGYPDPFLRATPDPRGDKVQQLLWGDFVTPQGQESGDWTLVRGRNEVGWIRRAELQDERLLEINFIDVGQGDGAFIVTPDDEFLLVDAGASDNMRRFLSWRFNLRRNPERVITIRKAVISHPDSDHYKGFEELFESPQFRFDTVFHNGLVERMGNDRLGPEATHDGRKYHTEVVADLDALRQLLAVPARVGRMTYPRMLRTAIDSGRVDDIRALSVTDGFLPGYEPGQTLTVEVLAPVPETVAGQPALRRFKSNDGVTKNGHSVVLRLVYGHIRILLGGDLNIPAELYLLGRHTGRDAGSADAQEREAVVAAARAVFEADIAKACHHGSADFTDLFLRAVNPVATVVSSGDDEPHAHPRPDTLGAIGKHGRGPRPLIFSTELSRSTKESIKEPGKALLELDGLYERLQLAQTDAERAQIRDLIAARIERSVAVYGMIGLRTDGQKVIMTYKLEKPAASGREFDVHRLEPDANGALHYVSEH